MEDRTRGFTLIELLIVIAIIGILSATVLVSLNTARAKARDVRRLQDITQMQKAVELYYHQYGQYPTACGGLTNTWRTNSTHPSFTCASGDFIDGLTPFLARLPVDPGGTAAGGYMYRVSTDRQEYKIMAWTTVETPSAAHGTPNSRCAPSCTSAACLAYDDTYAKYTPSAACW